MVVIMKHKIDPWSSEYASSSTEYPKLDVSCFLFRISEHSQHVYHYSFCQRCTDEEPSDGEKYRNQKFDKDKDWQYFIIRQLIIVKG